MGDVSDLGAELEVDQRLIESALPAPEAICRIGRHVAAVRRVLLPAVREFVPGGARIVEPEAELIASIQRELDECRPAERVPPSLARLVGDLIRAERRTLLPALEAEVMWYVLEDLGGQLRAGRAEPAF
jgi:hypothetical protein